MTKSCDYGVGLLSYPVLAYYIVYSSGIIVRGLTKWVVMRAILENHSLCVGVMRSSW